MLILFHTRQIATARSHTKMNPNSTMGQSGPKTDSNEGTISVQIKNQRQLIRSDADAPMTDSLFASTEQATTFAVHTPAANLPTV